VIAGERLDEQASLLTADGGLESAPGRDAPLQHPPELRTMAQKPAAGAVVL
jgi:hypothetical protein